MSQSTSLETDLKDLSLNDENKWRASLKTWLEESRHGQRLQERYNDYMESCSSENEPVTASAIIDHFWGRNFKSNILFLPKDLYREMYGIDANNKPMKELCPDEEMVRLAHLGCLDLLEGGWVYPKLPIARLGAKTLDAGFKQKFKGESLNWVERSLTLYKKMYMPSEHYGKMICFVQSSGTGKSRLMAEWARKRPLLSVCFRNIRDFEFYPEMGWPPADKPICQFLTSSPLPHENSNLGCYKAEEFITAFLGALFSVASEKISQSESLEGFNRSWSFDGEFESDQDLPQLEKTSRHAAFEQVVSKARKMLEEEQKVIHSLRRKIVNTQKDRGFIPDVEGWAGDLHNILIKGPAEELLSTCKKKNFGKGDFILVFDEYAQLGTIGASLVKTPEAAIGILDVISILAFQRVIKACEDLPIWSFLIDTTPTLITFHPVPRGKIKSFRPMAHIKPLHADPIIDFDVMATKENLARTPAQSLELKFLKYYGRPFWSILNDDQIVKSVTHKILCADRLDHQNVVDVLAVFSSRVLLELGPSQVTGKLVMDSVHYNMRILTGLTLEGIATTCAPSEPIAAVIASHILLQSDNTYKAAMETLIHRLILGGSVLEKGLQGDLVARLILMLSRDATVSPDPENPTPLRGTVNRQLVPDFSLSSFIETLIGDSRGIKGLELRLGFHNWARQYRMNFTHFVQLETPVKELPIDVLYECWRRGVALVCSYGQPVFDIIFVMCQGGLASFQWEGFSFVIIQVKNRTSTADSTLVEHITSPVITRDGGKKRWKPEHLVIVMDIGTEQTFDTGGHVKLSHRKAQDPCAQSGKETDSSHYLGKKTDPTDNEASTKRSRRIWDGYVEEEPECYLLEIRNHSFGQYPALWRFARDSWDSLWEEGRRPLPDGFEDLGEKMASSLKPFTSLDDFE